MNNAEKVFGNVLRNSGVNSNVSNRGRGSVYQWIMWILILVLFVVLLMLLVFVWKYLTSECVERKGFADYLFGLDWDDACVAGTGRLGEGSGELAYDERALLDEEEVYLIGDQVYGYDAARCKCGSYGGKLATKSQVMEAYNKGMDNCLYGWAEGQNAYYSTQPCTWEKLQRGKKEDRGKCGKIGVNGGYFSNPNIQFGALCYGVKPEGEVVIPKKPYCPKPDKCTMMGEDVGKQDGDTIMPFNGTQWSAF